MVTATGIAPGSEMTAQMEQVEERNVSGVLHVAAIFGSHMVLQRNKPIAVFGALAADCAGMEVVAEIHDFDGSLIAQEHAYSSQNVVNGFSQWRVMLPAQPEGGPYTLRIVAGNDAIEFDDVLIGEVWLAGGQSNMELELRNSEHADEALEDCADPLLRFYNVPKTGVINRNAENTSSWQESSPENSGVMSAVAYYFARKLRSELDPDLPVGIVDCYIGGTSISCWMSEDALNSSDAGRDYLTRYQRAIAGKTQQQFELETSEWESQVDEWNANVAAAREADPQTRTYRVEITAPNPQLTRSGLSATIHIASGVGPAHLVPLSSLVLDASGVQGVRYVLADDKVAFAKVNVIQETPQGIWVTGLKGPTRVITVGQSYVAEGQKVRVAAAR